MTRNDARDSDAIRTVTVETGFQHYPEGSVLYGCGKTRLLISASVEAGVKPFLTGSGKGWITSEYEMHPRANRERQRREGRRIQPSGRTQEIQRLIGRALRAAVHLKKLGERTITVDCDVLDADGGTRTAAITGGYIALVLALDGLRKRGLVEPGVLREPLAAVSVGLVNGKAMLDLCYAEDSNAQVDLNVVATQSGSLIEVQGTAEHAPVTRAQFDRLVDLALKGTSELIAVQNRVLERAEIDVTRLLG
ncbi:MAG: ribonuclease PH [Deltaproteobacteria bacterium]|nr:ribonuclease PH [Deltaproteobacteria bacterium]